MTQLASIIARGAAAALLILALGGAADAPSGEETSSAGEPAADASSPGESVPPSGNTATTQPENDDSVVEIQRDLKALMYYRGAVDGVFLAGTKNALAAFLADERSDLPAAPSVDVLARLRLAVKRQTHGKCPKPAKGLLAGSHIACAVVRD